MSRFCLSIALAAAISFSVSATTVYADGDRGNRGWSWSWSHWVAKWEAIKARLFSGGGWSHGGGNGGSHAVPELDPNLAGSAVVLVVGGVAYIASRRREQEE